MNGLKALALESYCLEANTSFTRFDYRGHGDSNGNFEDGDIGCWLSDALSVFDNIAATASTNIIIIGSSMGAWIATLLARQRMQQTSALITLAAAPDFTEKLLLPALNKQQREKIDRGETIYLPSDYDDGSPYPISPHLIKESSKQCILSDQFALDMPVRLIHGTADKDVPHGMSVDLMECIQSSDVQLTLIKNADHRLSSPSELDVITATLGQLLA